MTGRFFGLICGSILVFAAGCYLCLAQSNDPQTITHLGDSVQGVQLSITMTNNIFPVGSSVAVMSATKNLATNDIILNIAVPTLNFDLILSNDAGKLYHVTSRLSIRGSMHQFETIKPGGESFESIPVTFVENIEPGDYTLKATRHFSMGGRDFELESNSIKVQITK
jgi:hypothetical protein